MLSEHKLPQEVHSLRAEESVKLKRSFSGSFNPLTRNLGLCNGFVNPQLLQMEVCTTKDGHTEKQSESHPRSS